MNSPRSAPVESELTMSEPLALEGADVGRRGDRLAALVGGDAAHGGAGADGGAAGQQGHGLGRPAVVAQRGQTQAVRGWSGRCCRWCRS